MAWFQNNLAEMFLWLSHILLECCDTQVSDIGAWWPSCFLMLQAGTHWNALCLTRLCLGFQICPGKICECKHFEKLFEYTVMCHVFNKVVDFFALSCSAHEACVGYCWIKWAIFMSRSIIAPDKVVFFVVVVVFFRAKNHWCFWYFSTKTRCG